MALFEAKFTPFIVTDEDGKPEVGDRVIDGVSQALANAIDAKRITNNTVANVFFIILFHLLRLISYYYIKI
jgi:hypothetical protein